MSRNYIFRKGEKKVFFLHLSVPDLKKLTAWLQPIHDIVMSDLLLKELGASVAWHEEVNNCYNNFMGKYGANEIF